MPLFIDRLPRHHWVDNTHTPPIRHWSIRLAVLPSPIGIPSSTARPQQWVVDTGFTGEAFAWRHHLEDAGLDPDTDRGVPVQLRASANVGRVQVPVRLADLWLVSNLLFSSHRSLSRSRGESPSTIDVLRHPIRSFSVHSWACDPWFEPV